MDVLPFVRQGKVVELSEFRVLVREVVFAVALAHHVLLSGLAGASLRAAVQAFVIVGDDKVEVGEQGLDFY